MRSTASSPKTLGMIETRKSMARPSIATLKRPSCGTRRQHPFEGLRHADLQPAAGVGIEGVGDDGQEFPAAARQQAPAPRGLRRGEQVKRGLQARQVIARQHAIVKSLGQRRGEFHRTEARVLFKIVERGAATGLRLGDGGRQQRIMQADGTFLADDRVHLMLPASSKIGKYISTTITPMMMPMRLIRAGSIRRVARLTQRESSSS